MELAAVLNMHALSDYVALFLYYQENPDMPAVEDLDIIPRQYYLNHRISIFSSAVATFYSPSDISGIGGMRRERIRAVARWRLGPPRYDCIYVETSSDPNARGFRALTAARVRAILSIRCRGTKYPCALVEWYTPVGAEPDEETGMWMVEPERDAGGDIVRDIIHLDTVLRLAHLMPVYGHDRIPADISSPNSLDRFDTFFVSKYADHHAHEVAF